MVALRLHQHGCYTVIPQDATGYAGFALVMMPLLRKQALAVIVTVSALTLVACASEPPSSGSGEPLGASEKRRLPPDYNRGPQQHNFQ
jgi:hypothetical protein